MKYYILNEYDGGSSVLFDNLDKAMDFIKEMQNTFKEIFDGYIQKKQFTLSYSDQGNKYNYNAYELTTELGTLILDNEGKVTTIMGRTIFDS